MRPSHLHKKTYYACRMHRVRSVAITATRMRDRANAATFERADAQ